MKLGELIIELGTKGNTKELEKTLSQLKDAEKKTAAQIKLNKDLAKATSEEEKKLIRKNHAQKEEIALTEKTIKKNNERNKSIKAGIKGFSTFISAVSLAIGVLDRFINVSAKSNQNLLTLSKTSGVNLNTINKYTSAARSLNYNVSRETVAQSFASLSNNLRRLQTGEDVNTIPGALGLLAGVGGKSFNAYGMNSSQFMGALREGIQGVNDEWATDILGRLGLSPDLLPMLRMSKSEFSKVSNRFLDEKQIKEQQILALELQKQRDELVRAKETLEIQLIPIITQIYQEIIPILPELINFTKDLTSLVKELISILRPIVTALDKILKHLNRFFGGEKLPNDIPPELKKGIEAARTRQQKQDAAIIANAAAITALPLPKGIKSAGYSVLGAYMGMAHWSERKAEEKYLRKYSKEYSQNIDQKFYTTINTTEAADVATVGFFNKVGNNMRQVLNGQKGFIRL